MVDSWKRAFDLFPSGSKFITDIPTLDRIAKLAAEGSALILRRVSRLGDSVGSISEDGERKHRVISMVSARNDIKFS